MMFCCYINNKIDCGWLRCPTSRIRSTRRENWREREMCSSKRGSMTTLEPSTSRLCNYWSPVLSMEPPRKNATNWPRCQPACSSTSALAASISRSGKTQKSSTTKPSPSIHTTWRRSTSEQWRDSSWPNTKERWPTLRLLISWTKLTRIFTTPTKKSGRSLTKMWGRVFLSRRKWILRFLVLRKSRPKRYSPRKRSSRTPRKAVGGG